MANYLITELNYGNKPSEKLLFHTNDAMEAIEEWLSLTTGSSVDVSKIDGQLVLWAQKRLLGETELRLYTDSLIWKMDRNYNSWREFSEDPEESKLSKLLDNNGILEYYKEETFS